MNTFPIRYFIYAGIGLFLAGGVIGAVIMHDAVKPVVVGRYIGVVTVRSDTVYLKPVSGVVTTHTTSQQPVKDSVHTIPDYTYGFKLVFPDSAKLALDVNTKNVPKILDSLLGISYTYTPAPRITITTSRVDTVVQTQKKKLFGVVIGGGATYAPYAKQLYYGITVSGGYKIAEF